MTFLQDRIKQLFSQKIILITFPQKLIYIEKLSYFILFFLF